jgi:spore maturation protein CgeB
MRVVMFYHSAISDWNHGNAHFLRGIATELLRRGHDVEILEDRDAWSVQNLLKERGPVAISEFHGHFPQLRISRYDRDRLKLDTVLAGADLVIVHEWNDPGLVWRLGQHRASHGQYRLIFHDTHHRSVSAPQEMARYDLAHYDAVLVYGASIREVYLAHRWAQSVYVWHEAADTTLFRPLDRNGSSAAPSAHSGAEQLGEFEGDLVWIGNWGDDERAAEIHEFLIEPVGELNLKARVYGVRYPEHAVCALRQAGIEYSGWLPNYEVPRVFSRFRVTIHIPRGPYRQQLSGIPTIRPFEAMACGIPLVCAYWNDTERLFEPERDYLVAKDGREMTEHLRQLLTDGDLARELSNHGRKTILDRHTCAHRVDELLGLFSCIQMEASGVAS